MNITEPALVDDLSSPTTRLQIVTMIGPKVRSFPRKLLKGFCPVRQIFKNICIPQVKIKLKFGPFRQTSYGNPIFISYVKQTGLP